MTAAKLALGKLEIETGDRALVHHSAMGTLVARELERRGVQVTFVTDEPDLLESVSLDQKLLACPETLNQDVRRHGKFEILVAGLSEWLPRFGFEFLANGCGIVDTDKNAGKIILPKHVGVLTRTDLSTLLNRRRQVESAIGSVTEEASADDAQLQQQPFDVSIVDIGWKKLPLGDTASNLVISYETGEKDLPVVKSPQVQFSPDATYLITGGFGGFGQKTALWLAEHGAKHIVLTGRSGANTDEKKAFINELEELGIHAIPAACDTGNLEQLTELFAEIKENHPPLKGVSTPVPSSLTKPFPKRTWRRSVRSWVPKRLVPGTCMS